MSNATIFLGFPFRFFVRKSDRKDTGAPIRSTNGKAPVKKSPIAKKLVFPVIVESKARNIAINKVVKTNPRNFLKHEIGK